MILRRLADSIKGQNWSTVVLEVLIVVVGIFIGLQVDDWNQARKEANETDKALMALESDMRSDLLRLDQVIQMQQSKIIDQGTVAELLNQKDFENEVLGDLLISITLDNPTYYPNRSAYEAMKAGGNLAALRDGALRLQIARLYERQMVRQNDNAALYDQVGFDFMRDIREPHWDRTNKKLLTSNPDSAVIISNGMQTLQGHAMYYVDFLTNILRPEMLSTLELIDAYQNGDGQ